MQRVVSLAAHSRRNRFLFQLGGARFSSTLLKPMMGGPIAMQKKLQDDSLRQAKPSRLSQLIVIAESWPAMQGVVTQLLQREVS